MDNRERCVHIAQISAKKGHVAYKGKDKCKDQPAELN